MLRILLLLLAVAGVANGARSNPYCSACEEEIWEQVPCSALQKSETIATDDPETTTPTPPLTTPEPATTIDSSYSEAYKKTPVPNGDVRKESSKTFNKCYCQCRAGCKQFCRKVVANQAAYPQSQNVTQVSETMQQTPEGYIKIKHLHQQKFLPKDSSYGEQTNYIGRTVPELNGQVAPAAYADREPAPIVMPTYTYPVPEAVAVPKPSPVYAYATPLELPTPTHRYSIQEANPQPKFTYSDAAPASVLVPSLELGAVAQSSLPESSVNVALHENAAYGNLADDEGYSIADIMKLLKAEAYGPPEYYDPVGAATKYDDLTPVTPSPLPQPPSTPSPTAHGDSETLPANEPQQQYRYQPALTGLFPTLSPASYKSESLRPRKPLEEAKVESAEDAPKPY